MFRAAIPLFMMTAGLYSHAQESRDPSDLVVFGSMHETIAKQQHQARVSLKDIIAKPHFHGIGAMEGLRGEITIIDSTPHVTSVTKEGDPQVIDDPEAKATLLAGRYIAGWKEATIEEPVEPAHFDETIRALAGQNGIDTSRPFVFMVQGSFIHVRLHVINGACPVHARMQKIELKPETRPYEWEAESMTGTLIGIHAKDAVGKLTHPATSTHTHLLYQDEGKKQLLTGHIETVGLAGGAVVRFPEQDEQGSALNDAPRRE